MLPDPRDQPLLKPDDVVKHLKSMPIRTMSRSAFYAAIGRGEVPVIRYGRSIYVVNALLQKDWGLTDLDMSEAPPEPDGAFATKLAAAKQEVPREHNPNDAA